jgi:hypothetical protein
MGNERPAANQSTRRDCMRTKPSVDPFHWHEADEPGGDRRLLPLLHGCGKKSIGCQIEYGTISDEMIEDDATDLLSELHERRRLNKDEATGGSVRRQQPATPPPRTDLVDLLPAPP